MEEKIIETAIYLGMLILHILEIVFIKKGKTDTAEKIAKKKEKALEKLKIKEKKLEVEYSNVQKEIKENSKT